MKEISIGTNKFTRMRMRLKDKYFVDTNNLGRFIRAVKVAFFDSSRIDSDAGIGGNYFVWENIDVKKYQDFKWKDTDAVILDAYVRLHFFSGTTDTDASVEFPPEILAMDNLYVMDDNYNAFPVSINFAVQHTWLEDADASTSVWDITANPVDTWPNVMHISGNFGNMPTATKKLLLFFDFIDPLEANEYTKIGCSVVGITSTGCKIGYGAKNVTEGTFVNVKTNGGFLYTMTRYTHFLEIDVDSSTVIASTKMSIVFPFKHFSGDAMSKLINAYENDVPLNPSWIAVDENWKILHMVDFGVSSTNYPLNIFDDNLVVSDYYS